jgi:hypothetical protein
MFVPRSKTIARRLHEALPREALLDAKLRLEFNAEHLISTKECTRFGDGERGHDRPLFCLKGSST